MQGRWTGVDWIVVLVALAGTTGAVEAAATPPKYRLVDLGPAYTDRDSDGNDYLKFGNYPKIASDGNIKAWARGATAGDFSAGPVQHPEKPWLTIGYELRESGGSNLLPDAIAKDTAFALLGLSATGEVVGVTGGGKGVYFDSATGEIISPKPLPGRPASDPYSPQLMGINSLHQLVGSQDNIPTLYLDPKATPLKLEDLIDDLGSWDLSIATGINDLGLIVGLGVLTDQAGTPSLRYFRLDPIPTPVPEPGSLLVFAFAAGAVLWSRKGGKGRASRSH